MPSSTARSQPSSSWLQRFTPRKMLGYFLVQLLTFAILSAFSLNILALCAISAAMPFALEISYRWTASRLNGLASGISNRAEQAPSPAEASSTRPEPDGRPIMLQINRAITTQNSPRAIQLINQQPLQISQLQALCRDAISANNTAVFEHIIALPQFAPHIASDDNQLLHYAIISGRCPMVNTLLLNQEIQNTADAHNNALLNSACMRGLLPIVEAFLGLPNVVRELQRKSDTCIGMARLFNHREIEQRLIEASGHASPYQAVDRLPTLLHELTRNRESAADRQKLTESASPDSKSVRTKPK